MKKFIIGFLFLLSAGMAWAAVDDIFVDENLAIDDVTFENSATTTSLLVMANSLAETFAVADDGSLTVFNSAGFSIGSDDPSVKSIIIKLGSSTVACGVNATTSESFAMVPADAINAYNAYPSATTTCQSLCPVVANATGLNPFPTCGAASCASGFHVSGAGASAVCAADAVISNGGGGGGGGGGVCQTLLNVLTYNSYPTCGAAICASGFKLSGVQTNATCVLSATASSSCPVLANVSSYNVYPTCGAAVCSTGSILKGAGAMAICERQSDGGAFCGAVTGVEKYNDYPQCGAKTCLSGYKLSGSGSNAVCRVWLSSDSWATSTQSVTVGWATGKPIDVEVELLMTSSKNVAEYARLMGSKYKIKEQVAYFAKIKNIAKKYPQLSMLDLYNLNNFAVYGSLSTVKWLDKSQGWTQNERLYLLESYERIYKKLPASRADWRDCLLMANSERPKQISKSAEEKAVRSFKTVYKRLPNFRASQQADTRAFNFIAYGLRSKNKDAKKEAVAARAFQTIFKRKPFKPEDWDVVRAVAYSGAKR